MSNVCRLRLTDRIFFVTVNLQRNLNDLAPGEYAVVLRALEESRRRLGFLLFGYVLMPDHWHALLFPHPPLSISRAVQDVKYVSARRLNRLRQSHGALWQRQFRDRFVRHEKEFRERLGYMHFNPVRKGLVARPEDWRWSSYNNFDPATRMDCPIQIDYVWLPEGYGPNSPTAHYHCTILGRIRECVDIDHLPLNRTRFQQLSTY